MSPADTPPDGAFVVELQDWARKIGHSTRGQIKRRAVGSLVGGFGLGALVIGGIATVAVHRAITHVPFNITVKVIWGICFLSLFVTTFLYNGFHLLRNLPDIDDSEVVNFSAPYAFAIVGGTIHFPARFGAPAEDWAISNTTFEVIHYMGGAAVLLKCRRRRPRRFIARSIVMTPREVVTMLERAV